MRHACWLALAAALACTALAYLPGLAGGFLFDDFVNLSTLGAYGRIDDLRTLLLYLTSGIADPTGRPVAVASFLLDARNWPADPWPFKRTNLLLHLGNGVLLFAVLLRMEHWLDRSGRGLPATRRPWAALLGATLWMSHPLFVSTTLYVVQRHAMLPLTFVLLALLCWERACAHFLEERRRAAWTWATVGMGGCFLMAALSKANGMLAPLLVLLAHLVVIKPAIATQAHGRDRALRLAGSLLLLLPALLVLLAIAQRAPDSLSFAGSRRFTLGERLLTEPRILLDYLWHLWAPAAGGGGVFVEAFPKSTGWLEPITTLPALLLVLAAPAAAWLLRLRFPAAATAVLFYFAAHLMESTVIMLELYFEHRNYLPAALLFWPLARWIAAGSLLPRVRPALGVLLPALLLLLTWQRAQVWGDPVLLATLAARSEPRSVRAQMVSAAELGKAVGTEEAIQRLREALHEHGPTTSLAFNLVGQECAAGRLSPEAIDATRAALQSERTWQRVQIEWLRSATYLAASGQCDGFDLEVVGGWLEVANRNRFANQGANRRQNLLHLRGVHALLGGAEDAALHLFDQAVATKPNPDTALTQAAILGRAKRPQLGLRHLDHYERLPQPAEPLPRNMQALHRWILLRSGYHESEFAHLRQLLREDAANAAPTLPPATPETVPQ